MSTASSRRAHPWRFTRLAPPLALLSLASLGACQLRLTDDDRFDFASAAWVQDVNKGFIRPPPDSLVQRGMPATTPMPAPLLGGRPTARGGGPVGGGPNEPTNANANAAGVTNVNVNANLNTGAPVNAVAGNAPQNANAPNVANAGGNAPVQNAQYPQGAQNAQGTQSPQNQQGVQNPQGTQNAQNQQGVQNPQGAQNANPSGQPGYVTSGDVLAPPANAQRPPSGAQGQQGQPQGAAGNANAPNAPNAQAPQGAQTPQAPAGQNAPQQGAQGTAPSQQYPTFTALPQPVRDTPLDLPLSAGSAQITPPAHPGPQPLIVSVDTRCPERIDPCGPAGNLSSPYGWNVCVRDARTCNDPENADPSTLAGEAVRTLDSRGGAALQRNRGVVMVRNGRINEVGALRADQPARWPYALLVNPSATEQDTHAAVPPALQRVAFVLPRPPADGSPLKALEERLHASGVATAWFPTRVWRDPDSATRLALSWLFAGADADLCRAGQREQVVGDPVRIACARDRGEAPAP